MELCNGGSLYEIIDSPENAYGLEEEEFKKVMSDVGEIIDTTTDICLSWHMDD